jgi:hypothetical protein
LPSYAELVRNGGDAAGAAGAPARAAEAALARGGPIALCAASITVRDSAFTPLLRRATSLLATLSTAWQLVELTDGADAKSSLHVRADALEQSRQYSRMEENCTRNKK